MTFRKFISDSKKQLDISIQSADKFLINDKRITELLTSDATIEQKTDGVKLTVLKIKDKGNVDDYIFAYKGHILYKNEYNYQPNTRIQKDSIGCSQFKKVFQHFSNLTKNDVPVGTELFIEFLMRKPTLSSSYTKLHKMVLIGYSQSTYTEKFGNLITNNSGMQTSLRIDYAKQLNIDVPQLLFEGILGTESDFQKGIKNDKLKSEFALRKSSITWNDSDILLSDLKEMFLGIESKYGGIEEGVILKYSDKILKFQQAYQNDQDARMIIKMKYREADSNKETEYWENIKSSALEISNNIVVKSRKLPDILQELSLILKKFKIIFEHSKKTNTIIKDDIQLNAKTLLIKKMRGNNNALVIGKFRVLTKNGHFKLIKRASSLYDNVVVCIVTNKNSKDTKSLRTEMIQKVFPNVEIIHAVTGNVKSIINKSPININVVYTGSDRVHDYQRQLQNMIGTDVKELARTSSDISASKVIDNIKDEDFFKNKTPESIHSFYNQLKELYE